MAETIIVAGSLAQRPGNGGHATVFLQYLLGFRSLGYDVLFLDRLEPGMCVDGSGQPAEFGRSENVRYLAAVMEGAGLGGCWSVGYDGGAVTAGLDRRVVVERAQRSVLLVNVMGYLDDEELLAAAPITAFLDVDPGFGQMWRALGLHDAFVGHDHYVTVGSRGRHARLRRTRRRHRVDHDAATGRHRRLAGYLATGRADTIHDDRNLARAVRADRIRRSCLWAAGPRVPQVPRSSRSSPRRVRGRARHRRVGRRRPPATGRWWVGARRPPGGRQRSVRVPEIHQRVVGGVDDREEHVRRHARWMVQRSQRLLPRGRPAGARPGHGIR